MAEQGPSTDISKHPLLVSTHVESCSIDYCSFATLPEQPVLNFVLHWLTSSACKSFTDFTEADADVSMVKLWKAACSFAEVHDMLLCVEHLSMYAYEAHLSGCGPLLLDDG